MQVDPELKSPFAYIGNLAVNPKKNRIVYAYGYYKKLKYLTLDASAIKDIDYNLDKFKAKTLRIVDGLDQNVGHFYGITGCENYVYCAYSGRIPSDLSADWSYTYLVPISNNMIGMEIRLKNIN